MTVKNLLTALIFLLISCNTEKIIIDKTANPDITPQNNEQNDIIKKREKQIANYRACNTVKNNIINTELHIKFKYKTKQAEGYAVITAKPHFYPVDSVTLDAKEFNIKNIYEITDNKKIPLSYKYENNKLKIKLNKTYTRNDTFKIAVRYIANPEKAGQNAPASIIGNKGLYFFDTDTDNPQIWTQGETQSNSCWFPVIDSPNQKITQDFYITVKREFTTLSNGKLISSVPDENGMRTDYWRQEKPHAPYLAAIIAGKFSEITDTWRNIPLKVYVEPGNEDKARKVFGKTNKMIEFYSSILDYDFPWDKYSQAVVRNFVAGAMENTGAVTFANSVLNFNSEKQRLQNEITVAHELAHHWFGNLVTCESWANLPLNESFATYLEYLWLEHEYGRFEADSHLEQDFNIYRFESFFENKNLIRFYYKHRDDMFDAHSYQKGALILHMLRYTTGNDAFFKALNLYLKNNEYKTAEIHNLRLAFEEVTGEDMNWFFNEWFLNKGIPELNIIYDYDTNTKTAAVTIKQNQNQEKAPLYKIKTAVDIYLKDSVITKKIIITEQKQTFRFKIKEKPLFMNFDPDNAILCLKKENYTTEQYINILDKAPLYADKNEAFDNLNNIKSEKLNNIYLKLMKHPYPKFRYKAVASFKIDIANEKQKNEYIKILKKTTENNNNDNIKKLAKQKLNNIKKTINIKQK
ncbi:MAG: M1 family peptidase [Chlorobi bacterium]|nr:M1 family peptidase [Chlorobiota bacterium]